MSETPDATVEALKAELASARQKVAAAEAHAERGWAGLRAQAAEAAALRTALEQMLAAENAFDDVLRDELVPRSPVMSPDAQAAARACGAARNAARAALAGARARATNSPLTSTDAPPEPPEGRSFHDLPTSARPEATEGADDPVRRSSARPEEGS